MPFNSKPKLAVDRLQRAGPGEPVELWVYSGFEKDQWTARSPGDMTHAEHPGTAIQIGGDLYEIVMAEAAIEPGYVVRYGLKTWDARHVVRRTVHYTSEAQAQATESHLEEIHRQALRQRIVRFFFLAGLAPDFLQREWGVETSLNMAVVSAASALINFFIFMTLVAFFGNQMTLAEYSGHASPHPHLASLMGYLCLDSIARLFWIVASGEPHSTMLVALPSLLWEALTRPAKRAQKIENTKLFLQGDEVIYRQATGNLTVRSMLYDDLLAGVAPILYEGGVYKPLHWHEEGKGLKRRWVYEFEKIETDPKRKYREYTRPRTPERQEIVEGLTQRRDRVQIFTLIWGTFPRQEQLRLQAKYQFPAVQMTSATAGLLLTAAVLQGWATFMLGGSIVLLAGPIYIVFESLYRLYKSKGQGQAAASLLGIILSFFVHAPE